MASPGRTITTRRMTVSLSVAACLMLADTVSLNFILSDLLADLQPTGDAVSLLRLVPSIGSALVVFLSVALGSRWGERRVMIVAGAVVVCGALLAVTAFDIVMVTLGILLMSAGRSVVFVLAIAIFGSQLTERKARATAFATWSATLPFAALLMPLIAGLLVESVGWRGVAAVWVAAAAGALVLLWGAVPVTASERARTELITPALASVALTAIIPAINSLGRNGITTMFVWNVGIAGLALIALVIAMRRISNPTLSVAALRNGGIIVLLVIVVLFNFANLAFYLNVAFQYVYGLTPLQTAVVLVPSQLLIIIAARLAGVLIQRRGITFTGTAFLVAMGSSLLVSCLIDEASPVWWGVLILMLFGAANAGASVPLTNAVMDAAPRGEEGSASSFRSAASSLGGAVSVTVVTLIVFGTMSSSLVQRAEDAGLPAQQARDVVSQFEQGATSDQLLGSFPDLDVTVGDIEAAERAAYIEGVHAHGVVGACVTFAIAGLFLAASRRQQRRDRFERGQLGVAA